MRHEEICDGIIAMLHETLSESAEIDPDAGLLEDCGLDSLALIDLLVTCEERFSVEFDYDDLDMENLKSVNLLAKTILELLAAKNGE